MFGNLGVHILKNPAGTYHFVGTLPTKLGNVRIATTSDVMAGRSYFNEHGTQVAVHFPVFPTSDEAKVHAAARGVAVISADA